MTIFTQRVFGLIVLILLLLVLFTANAAREKPVPQTQNQSFTPTSYAVTGIAFRF